MKNVRFRKVKEFAEGIELVHVKPRLPNSAVWLPSLQLNHLETKPSLLHQNCQIQCLVHVRCLMNGRYYYLAIHNYKDHLGWGQVIMLDQEDHGSDEDAPFALASPTSPHTGPTWQSRAVWQCCWVIMPLPQGELDAVHIFLVSIHTKTEGHRRRAACRC